MLDLEHDLKVFFKDVWVSFSISESLLRRTSLLPEYDRTW